jgi:putative ATP-binding cassette transporter
MHQIRQFLKECWTLARPYWVSEERHGARLLLAVIIGMNLGEVYISVLFNKWNNDFYNSLQTVNKDAFIDALIRFTYLAFIYIVVAVYKAYLNQMLRLKWRRWMTNKWLARWLDRQHYYRMEVLGSSADNPDQRISEDVEQFIQLSLGLTLGMLSSIVTLISFVSILWGLSGSLEIPLFGWSISIPGYMVWVAIIYAAVGTWLTMKIGRPLIRLNFEQQRYEADFRFGLVRLRENSESIAFYHGEVREQAGLMERFSSVVDNFWKIIKRQKTLTWFTAGYNQIATIFPILVASPRFFAGQIQLGGLMQISSAFGHVQSALSYLIDVYNSLATWNAVVQRLCGFDDSMKKADATLLPRPELTMERGSDAVLASGLDIRLPNGQKLLTGIDLTIAPGQSLLITGASGSGKSTLLRCLAGLWPFMDGKLHLPDEKRMMFIPQKPYLPLGTLRQAMYYPQPPKWNDSRLAGIMEACKLEHLIEKLDEISTWSQILSLGEQQRVAFARVLLARPAFIFLDEATSALDEPTETRLYTLIKGELPGSALISVGHRPALKNFHDIEKSV